MLNVVLIAAQSIDGFITRSEEPGTDFCSQADQEFFFKALKEFDCLIMGRKTYELSRESIHASKATNRLRKIWTRNPETWEQSEIPRAVEFTGKTPEEVLSELRDRGKTQCALLGGEETYSAFLNAGLVDELWLTVEPVLFGSGKRISQNRIETSFSLEKTERLSPDVLHLKYKRTR